MDDFGTLFSAAQSDPTFQSFTPLEKRQAVQGLLHRDPTFNSFDQHGQQVAENRILSQFPDAPVVDASGNAPGQFVPDFKTKLDQMIADSGGKLSITDGARTLKQQADVYARKPNLAARPTPNAPHVRGVAADLAGDLDWAHANAPKYGLYFPMLDPKGSKVEPWHVQLDERNGAQIYGRESWGPQATAMEPPLGSQAAGTDFTSKYAGNNPALAAAQKRQDALRASINAAPQFVTRSGAKPTPRQIAEAQARQGTVPVNDLSSINTPPIPLTQPTYDQSAAMWDRQKSQKIQAAVQKQVEAIGPDERGWIDRIAGNAIPVWSTPVVEAVAPTFAKRLKNLKGPAKEVFGALMGMTTPENAATMLPLAFMTMGAGPEIKAAVEAGMPAFNAAFSAGMFGQSIAEAAAAHPGEQLGPEDVGRAGFSAAIPYLLHGATKVAGEVGGPALVKAMQSVADRMPYRMTPAEGLEAYQRAMGGRYHKPELASGTEQFPIPQETPHAVQERQAGTILQRQPEEAGIAGGERGGVEPVQQGQAVAAPRPQTEAVPAEAAQAQVATPSGAAEAQPAAPQIQTAPEARTRPISPQLAKLINQKDAEAAETAPMPAPPPPSAPEPRTVTTTTRGEPLTPQEQAYASRITGKGGIVRDEDLHLRPDVFQFRQRTRGGFTQWNPDFVGDITTWVDKNGEIGPAGNIYVVNGHNRVMEGRRFNAFDKRSRNEPSAPLWATREIEAPTAKRAKEVGALENIANSPQQDSVDIAHYLRSTAMPLAKAIENVRRAGINTQRPELAEAKNLAALPDAIFDQVYKHAEKHPEARKVAAAVSEHYRNEADQLTAWKTLWPKIEEGDRVRVDDIKQQAKALYDLRAALAQGEMDLGGDVVKHAEIRGRVVGAINRNLKATVSRGKGTSHVEGVADYGFTPEQTAAHTRYQQVQELIDKTANTTMPLGWRVTEAVKAIMAGANEDATIRDLIAEIKQGDIIDRSLQDPEYRGASGLGTQAPGEAPPNPPVGEGAKPEGAGMERPAEGVERAAGKPVEAHATVVRFEAGKKLTKEERAQVLRSVQDVYPENHVQKEERIDRNGNEYYVYPHTPDVFVKSDITGRMLRHYIHLPDGNIAHPSELFPDIKQSDIDRAVALEQHRAETEKYHEAQRNSRIVTPVDGDRSRTLNLGNAKYQSTGRKIEGSFFMEDADHRLVRVDGNDPKDEAHFAAQGFKRVSDPVKPEVATSEPKAKTAEAPKPIAEPVKPKAETAPVVMAKTDAAGRRVVVQPDELWRVRKVNYVGSVAEMANEGMVARKVGGAGGRDKYELRYETSGKPVELTAGKTFDSPWAAHFEYRRLAHRNAVEDALKQGLPVPDEVLKDYREIAFEHGRWDGKPIIAREDPFTKLKIGDVFVDTYAYNKVMRKTSKSEAKILRSSKPELVGKTIKVAAMTNVGIAKEGTIDLSKPAKRTIPAPVAEKPTEVAPIAQPAETPNTSGLEAGRVYEVHTPGEPPVDVSYRGPAEEDGKAIVYDSRTGQQFTVENDRLKPKAEEAGFSFSREVSGDRGADNNRIAGERDTGRVPRQSPAGRQLESGRNAEGKYVYGPHIADMTLAEAKIVGREAEWREYRMFEKFERDQAIAQGKKTPAEMRRQQTESLRKYGPGKDLNIVSSEGQGNQPHLRARDNTGNLLTRKEADRYGWDTHKFLWDEHSPKDPGEGVSFSRDSGLFGTEEGHQDLGQLIRSRATSYRPTMKEMVEHLITKGYSARDAVDGVRAEIDAGRISTDPNGRLLPGRVSAKGAGDLELTSTDKDFGQGALFHRQTATGVPLEATERPAQRMIAKVAQDGHIYLTPEGKRPLLATVGTNAFKGVSLRPRTTADLKARMLDVINDPQTPKAQKAEAAQFLQAVKLAESRAGAGDVTFSVAKPGETLAGTKAVRREEIIHRATHTLPDQLPHAEILNHPLAHKAVQNLLAQGYDGNPRVMADEILAKLGSGQGHIAGRQGGLGLTRVEAADLLVHVIEQGIRAHGDAFESVLERATANARRTYRETANRTEGAADQGNVGPAGRTEPAAETLPRGPTERGVGNEPPGVPEGVPAGRGGSGEAGVPGEVRFSREQPTPEERQGLEDYARSVITEGHTSVADFSREMKAGLGDWIEPHLHDLYDAVSAKPEDAAFTPPARMSIVDPAGNYVYKGVVGDGQHEIQNVHSGVSAHVSESELQRMMEKPVLPAPEARTEAPAAAAPSEPPLAKPPEKAVATGGEEPGGKPEGDYSTGARKSITIPERAERDLSPVEMQLYKRYGPSYIEGREAVNDGKIDPTKLAREVAETPRVMEPKETGALTYDRMRLDNALQEAYRAGDEAISNGDKAATEAAQQLVRDKLAALDMNDQAMRRGGREASAALSSFKMVVKDDYTLGKLMTERRVKEGRELTTAEQNEVRKAREDYLQKAADYETRIRAQQKEIEERDAKIADLQQQQTTRTIQREIIIEGRKGARTKSRAALQNDFESLRRELRSALRGDTLNIGPKQLIDAAPVLKKMALNLVRQGVNEIGALVDRVHEAVSDVMPDATKRDVRDALSGYGIVREGTADAAQKQLAQMLRAANLISQIEDAYAKQKPLRRGFKPEPDDPAVVALRAELHTALGQMGMREPWSMTTEQRQKSRQTRLKARIDDLTRRIAERDFSTGGKTPVPETPEYRRMLAIRNRLQSEYDAIKPPSTARTPTYESKLKAAKTRLNSQIKELTRRINEGDLEGKPKPPKLNYDSAATKILAERDELKQVLDEMIGRSKPRTLLQQAVSLWRAGLLTSPRTIAKVLVSHGIYLGGEEVSRMPAALMDAIIATKTGRRTVAGPNPIDVARAAYKAATDGMQEAALIMKAGEAGAEAAGMKRIGTTPTDWFAEHPTSSSVANAYISYVGRAHTASYRPFKVYAFERAQQEMGRLYPDMPEEERDMKAIEAAESAVFLNKNKLTSAFRAAKAQMGDAGPALDFLVPFPTVPSNLVLRTLEYGTGIPATAARAAARMLTKKAMTDSEQRQFSMTFGRGMTGAGLMYLGYKLATAGNAQGAPKDWKEAEDRKKQGLPPGPAVRVAGRWWELSPINPLGTLVGVGAGMGREAGPGQITKEALRELPYTHIGDMIGQLGEPGGYTRIGGQFAGSIVPTGISDLAAQLDTKERKRQAWYDYITARLPELRKMLEPKDVAETNKLFDPFNSRPDTGQVLAEPGPKAKDEYQNLRKSILQGVNRKQILQGARR